NSPGDLLFASVEKRGTKAANRRLLARQLEDGAVFEPEDIAAGGQVIGEQRIERFVPRRAQPVEKLEVARDVSKCTFRWILALQHFFNRAGRTGKPRFR